MGVLSGGVLSSGGGSGGGAGTVTSITAGTGLTGGTITDSGTIALSSPVSAANGGTGVANNASSTLTISGSFGTTLTVSGTTALTLPTSGTVAVLTNVTPTTSAISASAIDWSILKTSGGCYTKTLGANTTFTFSNQTAGQTIVVRLTNTASNWTVTWPTVKWPAGSTPVMTTGAKSDIYSFMYDGTNTFGTVVQNY